MQMFTFQPNLAWRQLKGKKQDTIGDKEMENYAHKLICIIGQCLCIETPYNACVY